jgi:hypothetical protein
VLKNNILVQAQGGRFLKSAVYILINEHLKKPSNAVIGPIEQFFNTLIDDERILPLASANR